jgi:hypothetical protein
MRKALAVAFAMTIVGGVPWSALANNLGSASGILGLSSDKEIVLIQGGGRGGGRDPSFGPGSGTGTGGARPSFGPGSGTGTGRCQMVRVRVCRGGSGDGRGPRCRFVQQQRC